MTDLQIYEKYCHNKPRSESLWRQCSDCAFFQVDKQDFTGKKKKNTTGFDLTLFFSKNQECQKKLEHKLGLDSYLLKPVQRITKYQLLLKVQSFFFNLNSFNTFSFQVSDVSLFMSSLSRKC